MTKLTAREEKKFAQYQAETAGKHIERAGYGDSSTTFSTKVDAFTLEYFKKEVEKYNENNPSQKLKMKNLMDQILFDYAQRLKMLNEEFDQKDLF